MHKADVLLFNGVVVVGVLYFMVFGPFGVLALLAGSLLAVAFGVRLKEVRHD